MKSTKLLEKSSALKFSLVMGIDFTWGMLLAGPGKQLFALWLETSGGRAHRFIDSNVEPMLWWSYGLIFLGQVWWFVRTSRTSPDTEVKVSRARKEWWLCLGLLLCIGLVQRFWLVWFIYPELPIKAFSMLVIILMVDLAVVYWLPSLLMTPKGFLPAVPSWRVSTRRRRVT